MDNIISTISNLEVAEVSKIGYYLDKFSVKELKVVAKEIGLNVSGNKQLIVQTISAYYKNKQLAKDIAIRGTV